MNIRWKRVILGALLLELILFVVLVPIGFVSTTIFFTAVPIGCLVFGYLVTRWLLRSVHSALLLHGALVGIAATAIYFGLIVMAPGGLSSAVATYGVPLFYFSQAMRIAGCLLGALHLQRQALAGLPPAARSAGARNERV
jgi:hypothetical protein